MSARPLAVRRLGRVEYVDGLAFQRRLVALRREGLVPDTLLLLEHPPVLTLGRGADEANLLVSRPELAARGIEVHETDRGGDVTYHGPGQVVGYPILDLNPDRKDVRKYVRDVEETMIRAARDFGVECRRVDGRIGVWADDASAGGSEPGGSSPTALPAHGGGRVPHGVRKLGAIGVHLSRWITSHGFAFNVAPDLAHFGLIVPCGIRDAGVTSLAAEGKVASMTDVETRLAAHAGEVFDREIVPAPFELAIVLVAVVRPSSRGVEALMLHRVPARGAFWQTVTGRLEPGEAPAAAAEREAREETGLEGELVDLAYAHAYTLDPALAPGRDPNRFVATHEDCFALRVPAGSEPRLSDEHDASEWLPLEDAVARAPFAGMKRALRLAGQ